MFLHCDFLWYVEQSLLIRRLCSAYHKKLHFARAEVAKILMRKKKTEITVSSFVNLFITESCQAPISKCPTKSNFPSKQTLPQWPHGLTHGLK